MNLKKMGYNPDWKMNSTSEVIAENDGQVLKLAGWVESITDKSKIIFFNLRDNQGIVQVTALKKDCDPKIWEKICSLTPESVVTLEGKVKANPIVGKGKVVSRVTKGVEINPLKIEIHSKAKPRVPIDLTGSKTKADTDTIFSYRELSIRMRDVVQIMNIKAEVARATREFFTANGFVEIFTPLILATSTEGGAAKFQLKYFDVDAVLAQSCQFYKQAAISVHEKVFGIIPSWRAEKSHTPKHITEFYQIENEIAFATEEEIMEVQENLVAQVVKSVKKNCSSDLEALNRDVKIPSLPFKRITFSEAKKILEEKLDIKEPADEDFSTPAETALSQHFEDPFFITEFPVHLRGIYYETYFENPEITRSVDLIAPEGYGELSSGGLRVYLPDRLRQRIATGGYSEESFDWYLRMFDYGMPPHAGYGLGFERLIRWIAGLNHVREASMFPRTPEIYKP
ncbi:MAG: aspartate--tRNA(Asn) ligase [Candidatus Odinarchaeota archaeon]